MFTFTKTTMQMNIWAWTHLINGTTKNDFASLSALPINITIFLAEKVTGLQKR